jgi:hypothetical protein
VLYTSDFDEGEITDVKTRATDASLDNFLRAISDEERHQDCLRVLEIMKRVTGEEPKLWGPAMVGFGSYHYRYESGLEGDWFVTGFSPRKANLTLYIMAGFDRYAELLERLGKFKTGKSCLYVKKLADVDEAVLTELIAASVEHMRRTYEVT